MLARLGCCAAGSKAAAAVATGAPPHDPEAIPRGVVLADVLASRLLLQSTRGVRWCIETSPSEDPPTLAPCRARTAPERHAAAGTRPPRSTCSSVARAFAPGGAIRQPLPEVLRSSEPPCDSRAAARGEARSSSAQGGGGAPLVVEEGARGGVRVGDGEHRLRRDKPRLDESSRDACASPPCAQHARV